MKTKYFIKITGLALLTVLLSFTSCEKQELIKVVGFVQGYVFDANTNEVLDNVKITWETMDGSTDSTFATATDGFHIDFLPSGSYILECSKENYAISTLEVTIPKDDIAVTVKGGGSKEVVVSVAPKLYSLDANIKGRVYKYDNFEPFFGQSYSPLANAPVKIKYQNRLFLKTEYETTTDAEGFFTFDMVPSAGCTVFTPDYSAATQVNYIGATNYAGKLSPGATTTSASIILLPYESWYTNRLYLIGSNIFDAPNVPTINFPIDAEIKLTFSRILNQINTDYYSSLVGGNGLVLYDQSFNPVPVTKFFNGTELTVIPNANLNLDEFYIINGFVWADLLHDYANVSVQFKTSAAK